MSCACSAAAVIFALGSNNMRIMAPNSYLMFHESSMGTEGKQMDIVSCGNHFLKIDKMINKKLEKHINLDNNFFENHSADLYLHARDALKLGIATHVGFPVVKFKLSMEMSFEMKSSKRHETDPSELNPKRCKYQKICSGAQCYNANDSLKSL